MSLSIRMKGYMVINVYNGYELYNQIKRHTPVIGLSTQEAINESRLYCILRNSVISFIIFLILLGLVMNVYCAITIAFPFDVYIFRKNIFPFLLLPFILSIPYQIIFWACYRYKYVIIAGKGNKKYLITTLIKYLKVI